MRYFQYDAYDEYGDGHIVTVTEEDIRRDYFPFWHKAMCRKYGDGEYSFNDCILDWATDNWAWEKKK